ncbi:hypothetical protein HPB49_020416 [Dermacentor silvarum]|uniref:Uncharacterized protein n=1 Tax=Dermacentor silvarum TaxID=543639 RepID=A0ACB8DQV2_DERSI|nr:hypothetical protein HPB49_020416 [Dermacentor silvarum]
MRGRITSATAGTSSSATTATTASSEGRGAETSPPANLALQKPDMSTDCSKQNRPDTPGARISTQSLAECVAVGSALSEASLKGPKARNTADVNLIEELPEDGDVYLVNGTSTYQSVARYSCGENFTTHGVDMRTCLETVLSYYIYSLDHLSIACGEPEIPFGGYVVEENFQVHDTVHCKCYPGHASGTHHGRGGVEEVPLKWIEMRHRTNLPVS